MLCAMVLFLQVKKTPLFYVVWDLFESFLRRLFLFSQHFFISDFLGGGKVLNGLPD